MGRQSQHCLEQSHQQHEVFGSHWVLPCLLQCPGCRIWSPTCPCTPQSSLSAPIAPAPLQLVHNAPLIHSAPQPVLHSVPFPAPAPLHLAPTPLPSPAPFAAPVHFAARAPLPLAAPAPVAPIVEPPSSQFHAQDEFGQFSFGYQNINSAKTESKDAFGVTRGSYQYVDANGVLQTVNYIADDINGFRVA